MLPLSVLTLALLGGFIFVTRWHPTRYYALRSDGYRLLFIAALAGAGLLLIAQLLSGTWLGETTGALWEDFVWSNPPIGFGRASAAFFMGASLCLFSNLLVWLFSKLLGKGSPLRFLGAKAAIDRTIKSKDDPLETFLYGASVSAREILISVKNGKVYAGRVNENFNPAFPITSIGMVLSRSGHRAKDTQQMKVDVDYGQIIQEKLIQRRQKKERRQNPNTTEAELIDKVYSQLNQQENREALLEEVSDELMKYQITIPLSEVQSVNFFDDITHEDYKAHFAPTQEQESK